MLAPHWDRSVLGVAAVAEAVTGLALIAVPEVVGRLLLAAEVSGVDVVIGRVTGIALLALGLGCWLGRHESGRSPALAAMLAYDLLVTVYLVAVGPGGEFVGLLLWPAVAVHAVLTLLLGYAWLKRS
jgi:hypothetical protein